MDGAHAMVGHSIRLSELLKKRNEVNYNIHQESLCGQVIKQSSVMETVVKVTNLIQDGNKSLSHCKFWAFLEETNVTYGDLLLHSKIRWLSSENVWKDFLHS
jgi:hypothetical protein